MPWAIPPWLALVEFLGLTAKEYDECNDNKAMMSTTTATMMTAMAAMAATPTTRVMATMATRTKLKGMVMARVTKTTTTMTLTMTIRQWDDNNVMAATTMG